MAGSAKDVWGAMRAEYVRIGGRVTGRGVRHKTASPGDDVTSIRSGRPRLGIGRREVCEYKYGDNDAHCSSLWSAPIEDAPQRNALSLIWIKQSLALHLERAKIRK